MSGARSSRGDGESMEARNAARGGGGRVTDVDERPKGEESGGGVLVQAVRKKMGGREWW
jgi:hypothetical protein